MAYRILYGNQVLFDPYTDDAVSDAKLTASSNAASYLEFTIPATHTLAKTVAERAEEVYLYFDSDLLYRGYIDSIEIDFDGNRDISCTGSIDYLKDTLVRPYSTVEGEAELTAPTSVNAYFEWLVNQHNEHCLDSRKQFIVGVNQGQFLDENNYIYRASSSLPTTASEIEDKILDELGGYIFVRYENDAQYLDLYADVHDTAKQIIDFGVNLTDFTKSTTTDSQYTSLRGKGATPTFHLKFAPSANPSADDMTDTPSAYVGTYVDCESSDSSYPSSYSWRAYSDPGAYGITGQFSDGTTAYLHVAYATASDGSSGFSTTDSSGRGYIGMLVDFTSADSTKYYDYTWSEYNTGDSGSSGTSGPKSTTATDALTLEIQPDGPTTYSSDIAKLGDVVYSLAGVQRYGYREYSYENTDCTTPTGLFTSSCKALNNLLSPEVSITVKAVDLALFMDGYTHMRVGQAVRIRSAYHDTDEYMMINSIELDLQDPSQSTYEIGASYDSLTGQQSTYLKNLNSNINKSLDAVDSLSTDVKSSAISAEEAKSAATTAAASADAAKEAASKAVTTVTVEYAVGTASEAPTDGWGAEQPTRTEGQTIWMRTVTTTADGSTETSSPTPVTGDQGDKGDTGDKGADGTGFQWNLLKATGVEHTVKSGYNLCYYWISDTETPASMAELGDVTIAFEAKTNTGKMGVQSRMTKYNSSGSETGASTTVETRISSTDWASYSLHITGIAIADDTTKMRCIIQTQTGSPDQTVTVRNVMCTPHEKTAQWCTTQAETIGKDGASVSAIKMEYALGDSSTSAPTTGWQSSVPDWQTGKYIWQRSVTTITSADGKTTTDTSAASLYGAFNSLANDVSSATTAANEATTAATNATTTANAASELATKASSDATTATSTANSATTAANEAKTAADAATSTANSAKTTATQTAQDLTTAIETFDKSVDYLQTQIDGAIETWFYEVEPTDQNEPAVNWTTTDLKNKHLGDLYYDTITGYCYRYQVQNNTYSWSRITDVDVTKALADAAAAQETANTKRRVFVSTPYPPYDVGDLWLTVVEEPEINSDETSTVDDTGEDAQPSDMKRCAVAKTATQTFDDGDWVLATASVEAVRKDVQETYATKVETETIASDLTLVNTTVSTLDTSLTETKEKLDETVTTVDGMTETVTNVQSYMSFSSGEVPTLTIGRTDSPFKTEITNSGQTFSANGIAMLTLDADSSSVKSEHLRTGKYQWQAADDGERIQIVYVG